MSNDIKLTLVGGEELDGEIYCIDPLTKAIVMKDVLGAYSLVNSNAITSISGDLSKVALPDPRKTGLTIQLDNNKVRDRELKAMMLAEKEIESQNFDVDPKVQQLFDRMRSIFPCSWDGVNMVIFDALVIQAPAYDTISVKVGAQNDDGIERVRKVLEGERKKLNMN